MRSNGSGGLFKLFSCDFLHPPQLGPRLNSPFFGPRLLISEHLDGVFDFFPLLVVSLSSLVFFTTASSRIGRYLETLCNEKERKKEK